MNQRVSDLLARSLEFLRETYRTQLHLQQMYVARHDLSGGETAAAARVRELIRQAQA